MDFEEFLWAMGDETIISSLKECFEKRIPLGPEDHRRAMNLFRQYMIVKRMPQVVETYVKTKDLTETDSVKKNIISLLPGCREVCEERKHVKAILDNIPASLSKNDKRFSPGAMRKKSTTRD